MIDMANEYQTAKELLIWQGNRRPGDLDIWRQVLDSLDQDRAGLRYMDECIVDALPSLAPKRYLRFEYRGYVIVLFFGGSRFVCCFLDNNPSHQFDSVDEILNGIKTLLNKKMSSSELQEPVKSEPEDTGPSGP